MRLALIAISTLLTGGGAAGVHVGVIPGPDQMFQAVRALGGDPAQLKSVEINPIRTVYDNVMRQVTSGEDPNRRLGLQTTVVVTPDFSAMQNAMPRPLVNTPNGFAPNFASQTEQFNNGMQDLRTHAARHGTPPR